METAAENVKGKLRSKEHLKLELEMDDKEIKLQATSSGGRFLLASVAVDFAT